MLPWQITMNQVSSSSIIWLCGTLESVSLCHTGLNNRDKAKWWGTTYGCDTWVQADKKHIKHQTNSVTSAVLPSVSCRSRTRRIWDSGISAMCLSGGGGLVCPSGLLKVLITLCRFLAICRHKQTKPQLWKVKVKKGNFQLHECVCVCVLEVSGGALCSVWAKLRSVTWK